MLSNVLLIGTKRPFVSIKHKTYWNLMNLLTQPFIKKFENANRILLAGAGGGFDIFCGLPLFFSLLEAGKTVFLANLSFTDLQAFQGEWLTPTMMKVTPETRGVKGIYFPEWYLTQWLSKQELDTPIYSFEKQGVLQLHQNYQFLQERLEIDAIALIDGGTDSLMRGDEDSLGTPGEDFASIAAAASIDISNKMLVCLGFGVDHFHGVSNDLSLAAIAEFTQTQQFLGSLSLLDSMPEVQKYREAAEYTFTQMPQNVSIVSSSILSAISGYYGDHHAT
ncbi:MAG: DUF1152 domain-containing protein, partial [Chloroflexota bacterium]